MAGKITAADGSERGLGGYKLSAPRPGTRTYDKDSANIKSLPPKVDLRPFMTNVEDQGDTNSCTANAVAGAYEYLVKRHQDEPKNISRLFLYYNARYVSDPESIEDEGSAISDAIEGLKQYGACEEPTWDFDVENVNEEPDQDSYDEGGQFLVESAKQVPVDLDSWRTALADGQPIIFGLKLFGSFGQFRSPGHIAAPTKGESSRESHGAHAMLCVGYSDPDEVFIVRNSWGSDWGVKGYCYIPYRYVMDSHYNLDDCWIIERLEVLEPDEEAWIEDDESVLEEVSTALSEMDEDTYEELLDAMGEVPFEQRLALIFLTAVGADGEISDEEITVVKEYLAPVIELTGGSTNVAGVIRAAKKLLDDEEILDESIELIWQHFDYDVLASMTSQIEEAASADGLSKGERKFIDKLTATWQEGADDEEEDDSEEEEEDSEEEDE